MKKKVKSKFSLIEEHRKLDTAKFVLGLDRKISYKL